MLKDTKITMGIVIEKELKEKVESYAKKEHRSMSSFICDKIDKYIKSIENKTI